MRGHDCDPGSGAGDRCQRLRLTGKAGERISVEHNGALARERRENQFSHGPPHSTSRSEHDDIAPAVVEELGKFVRAIDRTHHYREARCRVHG